MQAEAIKCSRRLRTTALSVCSRVSSTGITHHGSEVPIFIKSLSLLLSDTAVECSSFAIDTLGFVSINFYLIGELEKQIKL